MIPKKIHQIWIGDKKSMPSILMNTWKSLYFDWEYYLWTENEIEDLCLVNKRQYELAGTYAGKADIARYEILYKHGGFFIDADSLAIKKIDETIVAQSAMCVYESEKYRDDLLVNGYYGTVPRHMINYKMIAHISQIDDSVIKHGAPWKITGPLPFTNAVNGIENIKFISSDMFMPVHFEDEGFSSKSIENITKDEIIEIEDRYKDSYSYQFWGSKCGYSNNDTRY
jgi:mannosyltransferase OCH1-like enzyme